MTFIYAIPTIDFEYEKMEVPLYVWQRTIAH